MSKRLFGIITDKTGIPSALIVNNLNRSQAAQIAEARDKNGKVIKQQAYSIQKSVNLNGVTTASDPIDAGKQITIAGENYLVDQAAQNESNTAFVDVSISAVHSDEAAIVQIGNTPPVPESPEINLLFITAGADQILSGFIGSNQDGSPVSGTIQTVTPSLTGNVFSVKKGYVASDTEQTVPVTTATLSGNVFSVGKGYIPENKELTVPEAQITETDKKVTISAGYLNESKEYELASGVPDIDLSFVTAGTNQILSGFTGSDKDGNPVNGTIATVTPTLSGNKFTVGKGFVPENKELTVPEAKAPSVSGNVVTVYPGYVPEQVPVEIPKATATLSANVMTIPAGYHDSQTLIVPEAPSPTVSGNTVTIHAGYVPEETTVQTEGGSSGGGSMEIYKCAAVHEASWDGYKAIFSDGAYTFSEELTEGLTYSAIVPTVDKIYSSDALIVIEKLFEGSTFPMQGLLFYAPLHELKPYDETGRALISNGETYTTISGVKCAKVSNRQYIKASDEGFPIGTSARTLSFFTNLNVDGVATFVSYGYDSGNCRYSVGTESDNTLAVWAAGNTVIYTGLVIQKNKWNHVVVTFVGDVESLYLDGTFKATNPHSNITTKLQEFCIGVAAVRHNEPLNGYISEVAVWDRVLSPDEIKAEADRCLAMVTE